jgi:tetratricopeptide (TPR) repeat protein
MQLKTRILWLAVRFAAKYPKLAGRLVRFAGPLAARWLQRRGARDRRREAVLADATVVELRNDVAAPDATWEDEFALAQLLVRQRDYVEAARLFGRVAGATDADADARRDAALWVARTLEYAERFEAAHRAYVQYLKDFPTIGTLERRRLERRVAELERSVSKS